MANRPCARCQTHKTASIHSRHYRGEDGHPYVLDAEPGLKPMSEGMRNWRRESGYDEKVRAAKGSPCQVVSPVCTGFAEHLHEPLTRGRSGGLRAAVEHGGTIDCCDPWPVPADLEGQALQAARIASEHGSSPWTTEEKCK